MFEQALMLVPVGVVVGLAARSVCRADGRGSSLGWMAHRWTWPAVAVTVLGLLALGPRDFASAAASVACLVGLPLLLTNGWLRSSAASPRSAQFRGLASGSTPATPAATFSPLSPLGRGVGGEGWSSAGSAPQPSPLPKGEREEIRTSEVFETSEVCEDADEPLALLDDSVTHWLKRSRPSANEERIEGMTRAEFAAGQKQVAVHVAFCPPLPVVPVVTCELLDDADVRLRITSVQTFGVRIEAKRSSDVDQPLTVAVHFRATADAASAPHQPARSAA